MIEFSSFIVRWRSLSVLHSLYPASFHKCKPIKPFCFYHVANRCVPLLLLLLDSFFSSLSFFFLFRDNLNSWWYKVNRNRSTNSTSVNTLAPNINPSWPPTSPDHKQNTQLSWFLAFLLILTNLVMVPLTPYGLF